MPLIVFGCSERNSVSGAKVSFGPQRGKGEAKQGREMTGWWGEAKWGGGKMVTAR